jgi:hypothetical protein
MDVVAHHVEPVDVRLNIDNVEALQVPVAVWQGHGNTQAPSCGLQCLHERHVILEVLFR